MAYFNTLLICLPYIAVIWVYAALILLRFIRKFREIEYKWNELLIFGCYVAISLLLPYMIYLPGWTILIQLASIGGLLTIPLIEYLRIRRWNHEAEYDKINARDYELFIMRFPETYSTSRDIRRKIYHALIPTIILVCYSVALALGGISGLSGDQFGRFLIFNIGFVLVNLFTLGDLIRLYNFKYLPGWAVHLFTSAMKKKELNSYSSPPGTIMAISIFFVLPFPIFASIAMLIGISDSLASLVGKNFGKHYLRTGSDKKLEGTIAGAISGIAVTILLCIIFTPYWPWYAIILLSVIAGGVFALFDYIDHKHINDNLSVPIVAGLLMWLTAYGFALV
ncbi:MAG: hypothetical protein ACTSQI_08970 [Candidatus Helarchaeota archaeon]